MEDLPKVNNVRAIIDLFEENCRNETAQRLNKSMSKSFAGLSFSERKYKSIGFNDYDTLYSLDQRLQTISMKLKDYRIYSRDIHVNLQDGLIEIMAILSTIDIGNNTVMFKKREMVQSVKAQFKELSGRLPGSMNNVQQGFGDYTYKPFTWKRTNSIGGLKGSLDNPPSTPKSLRPQMTQYGEINNNLQQSPISSPKSFVYSQETDQSEASPNDEVLLRPSSFKRIPDFIIGGAAGTRHSLVLDTTLRGTSNLNQPTTNTLQRSTSEVTDYSHPKPILLGGSDYSKRWTNGNPEIRRRPVSLGGTIVTLNSAENIIAAMRSRESQRIQNEEVAKVEEEKKGSVDDTLQSVNLLKKFFEQKSVDNNDEGKSNNKEGERGNVEENNDDSSNGTIVEVEGEEDKILSLPSSPWIRVDEIEGLDTPVVRRELEGDEVIVSSSANEDMEEGNSFSSEQSIYLDPVDCEYF